MFYSPLLKYVLSNCMLLHTKHNTFLVNKSSTNKQNFNMTEQTAVSPETPEFMLTAQ